MTSATPNLNPNPNTNPSVQVDEDDVFIHHLYQRLQCIETIGISLLKETLRFTLCGQQITFSNGTMITLPNDLESALAEYCNNEPNFLVKLKRMHPGRIYENEVKHYFLDQQNQVHAKIDFSKFDLPLYTKILKMNHFNNHWTANQASIEFLQNLRILLHHKVSKDYWERLEISPTPILIDHINQPMNKDDLLNQAGKSVKNISKYLFKNKHLDTKQHDEYKTNIGVCKYHSMEKMKTYLYGEMNTSSKVLKMLDDISSIAQKPKMLEMIFSLEGESFKSLELDLTKDFSKDLIKELTVEMKTLLNAVDICVNISWTKQNKTFGELQCKITSDIINFKDYKNQVSPLSQNLMKQLSNAVKEAIELYLKNKNIKKGISVSVTKFEIKCLIISFALQENDKPWINADNDLREIIIKNIKGVFDNAVCVEPFMPKSTISGKQYVQVHLNVVLSSENINFAAFVKKFEIVTLAKENAVLKNIQMRIKKQGDEMWKPLESASGLPVSTPSSKRELSSTSLSTKSIKFEELSPTPIFPISRKEEVSPTSSKEELSQTSIFPIPIKEELSQTSIFASSSKMESQTSLFSKLGKRKLSHISSSTKWSKEKFVPINFDLKEDFIEISNFIKMQLVARHPLKYGLLNVICNLHGDSSFQGLPTHPEKLFYVLNEEYGEILKKQTTSPEYMLLFPSNGQTKLEELPISLILKLLNILTPYVNSASNTLCDEKMKKNVENAISFVRYVESIDPKDISDEIIFTQKKDQAIDMLISFGALKGVKEVQKICNTTLEAIQNRYVISWMKILSLYHITMHQALIAEYKDNLKQKEDDPKIDGMEMTSIARLIEKMSLEKQKLLPPIYSLVNGMSTWFKKLDELDIFLEEETYLQLKRDAILLIASYPAAKMNFNESILGTFLIKTFLIFGQISA